MNNISSSGGLTNCIENAIFPYMTDQVKATDKANKTRSTKWTYHGECSFATNYLKFLKIF